MAPKAAARAALQAEEAAKARKAQVCCCHVLSQMVPCATASTR
jgi:hypothetical protein